MPFSNTDEPIYSADEPAFLREKKKTAFLGFVASCVNADIPEEKFANLVHMRWTNFANFGLLDEGAIMVDILSAHRMGMTVNLQAAHESWLAALKRSREEGLG